MQISHYSPKDATILLVNYLTNIFKRGAYHSLGSVSSFVAEAIGLGFTTGLHRSIRDFKMDPVTLQVAIRPLAEKVEMLTGLADPYTPFLGFIYSRPLPCLFSRTSATHQAVGM